MGIATELDNGQKVAAGLTVFDMQGQPILALPAGAKVVFATSNEQIAQFRQGKYDTDGVSWLDDPQSLNGEVTTLNDGVGAATITGTVTWADGTTKSDVLNVNVLNSAPNTVSFTVGVPVSDSPPAASGGGALASAWNGPSSASLGAAYSGQVAGSGGTAPYAFALSGGSLPDGLSIGAANGSVTGTPGTAGTFNFTVSVSDAAGAVSSASCTIAVA